MSGMQPEQPAADPYAGMAEVPCYGVLVVEGVETGDTPRREFDPGVLTWAPLPLSFKFQKYENDAHNGACIVGRIDQIWRDGNLLRWTGALDNVGEEGREAIRLRRGNYVRGVSVRSDDIDQADVEAIYPVMEMPPEAVMMGEPEELDEAEEMAVEPDDDSEDEGDADALPVEDDAEVVEDTFHLPGKHDQRAHGQSARGNTKVSKSQRDAARKRLAKKGGPNFDRPYAAGPGLVACGLEPEKLIIHAGRIRSATLLAEPAFVDATMELGQSPFVPSAPTEQPVTLDGLADVVEAATVDARVTATPVVAAGYTITIPDIWPEEWFQEPTEMPPFGALHITQQGRVFGLLAPGDVTHRGFRASGMKVKAPTGIDYSEFMNKPAIVAGADGGVYRIPAGSITFGCGHAGPYDPRRADPAFAAQHYENTCSVAARIRVGENRHGTWVAGALLHGIDADTVERMMACALSGDWQGGKLKGALLVPVEGFPRAATASVRVRDDAVVASSIPVHFIEPEPEPTPDYVLGLYDLIASAAGRDPASRWAEIERESGYDPSARWAEIEQSRG